MLNARLRGLPQAHARCAFALRAAIAEKTEHRKNPCAIGISTRSEKYRARRRAIAPWALLCVLAALLATQDVVSMRAR